MLLEIRDLRVKYGNVEVLHGINLAVNEGEIVAILGANGAGKSTTLMAVSRIVKSSAGSIEFGGKALHRLKAHDVVKEGVIQVPEGRRIFNTLSVEEKLFPILKERSDQLGGTLSGGELQMLAIARGLMAEPKILLLDEPSLGLAPLLAKAIFRTLEQINKAGVTIVLVEQNARAALNLANRGYIMEVGNIVLEDSAAALLANPEVQKAYLGG